MKEPSAAQIQVYLAGLDYPVDKGMVLDFARSKGAPDLVTAFLHQLPERSYNVPTDIELELGKTLRNQKPLPPEEQIKCANREEVCAVVCLQGLCVRYKPLSQPAPADELLLLAEVSSAIQMMLEGVGSCLSKGEAVDFRLLSKSLTTQILALASPLIEARVANEFLTLFEDWQTLSDEHFRERHPGWPVGLAISQGEILRHIRRDLGKTEGEKASEG